MCTLVVCRDRSRNKISHNFMVISKLMPFMQLAEAMMNHVDDPVTLFFGLV